MLAVRLVILILDKLRIVNKPDLSALAEPAERFIIGRYISKLRFLVNRFLLYREYRIHKNVRLRKFFADLIEHFRILLDKQLCISVCRGHIIFAYGNKYHKRAD